MSSELVRRPLLFHALTRRVDRKNKCTKTKELSSPAMERWVKRSPGLLSVCFVVNRGYIGHNGLNVSTLEALPQYWL